jgi:hypothetical protein
MSGVMEHHQHPGKLKNQRDKPMTIPEVTSANHRRSRLCILTLHKDLCLTVRNKASNPTMRGSAIYHLYLNKKRKLNNQQP